MVNSIIRKKFVFFGKVQGVGFRAVSRYAAKKFNVNGRVTNNLDGTVTLILESSSKNIGIVINYLKHFFAGKIDHYKENIVKETGFTDFKIIK